MRKATLAMAILLAITAFALPIAAQEESRDSMGLVLGVDASYQLPSSGTNEERANELSTKEYFSFRYDSTYFDFFADMSASSDGKYSPESANMAGGTFGNIYVLMENGGLRTKLGPLSFLGGRLRHFDVIDSPYSLFINSGGITAPLLQIEYDGPVFFYSSRWIELNRSSTMKTPAWGYTDTTYKAFPDRGANVKTYGIKLGEMRFGLQDAAVYSNKYFDLEYFLNPLPQYFIQYSKTTSGRPWYANTNENDMLGLFWDWNRPGDFSMNAQFLMDDFNVYWLGVGEHNPWKAALTFGGRLETKAGSFGFYAAGATQFTFNAIGMDAGDEATSAYGYAYYPDTVFNISMTGTDWAAIGIEDNNIGYKYGENNLALQIDWLGNLAGFDLGAALEFRLAGANSPANPWGDWHTYPDGGTRWLKDDVLEKRVLATFKAGRSFGDWRIYGILKAGMAFDALSLRYSKDLDDVTGAANSGKETSLEKLIMLWAPTAGLDKFIFKFTLGGSYSIPFKK